MYLTRRIKFIFLIICLFQSANSFARKEQRTIGKILQSKGKVFKALERKKILKPGDILLRSDIIMTGKASFTKFQMIDDTTITLGPESSLMLQRFTFKNKNKRKAIFKILTGKIRAKIVNRAPNDALKFETKTISLGVRGTEFLINNTKNKNGGTITKVAVIKGKVALFDKLNDSVKEMVAGAQFISIIDSGNKKFNSKFIGLPGQQLKQFVAQTMTATSDDGIVVGSGPDGMAPETAMTEDLFLDDSMQLAPNQELTKDKQKYLNSGK